MQFDLTGAIRQIQEMGNAFLERLPYVAVALLVFAGFYLAAKVLRGVAEALRELPRALGHADGGAPGAKGS